MILEQIGRTRPRHLEVDPAPAKYRTRSDVSSARHPTGVRRSPSHGETWAARPTLTGLLKRQPIAAVHVSCYMHVLLTLEAEIMVPLRRVVRPFLNYKKGRCSSCAGVY